MRDPVDEFIDSIRSAIDVFDSKVKPKKKEFSFSVSTEDQEDATMYLYDFLSMLENCFGQENVVVDLNSIFSTKHPGCTRITVRK